MAKKTNSTETIIKAATKVFADVGFAGARVDVIAKRAGVNKATIYYNIGNKEVLYSKVLHSIFIKPLTAFENLFKTTESPEEKIKVFIRSIAAAIDKNPGLPNILMWEHASGGSNLPPEIVLIIATMLNYLTDILEEGEKSGIFKKQNPLLIQLIIVATMTFYKTSVPIRKRFSEFPETAKNLPENLTGHITEELETIILNAIRK